MPQSLPSGVLYILSLRAKSYITLDSRRAFRISKSTAPFMQPPDGSPLCPVNYSRLPSIKVLFDQMSTNSWITLERHLKRQLINHWRCWFWMIFWLYSSKGKSEYCRWCSSALDTIHKNDFHFYPQIVHSSSQNNIIQWIVSSLWIINSGIGSLQAQ